MTAASGCLIVGGGQAGFATATELRARGYDAPIRLVTDEPYLPYQRPPLSKRYLLEPPPASPLDFAPEQELVRDDIEVLTESRAAAIDRASRRVELRDGTRLAYDQLVLAVGARNRPAPSPDLHGAVTLRTRADADELREMLHASSHLVVIGGGFLGLEVAVSAAKLGLAVAVVELTYTPMGRVVTRATSRAFVAHHRAAGIEFHVGDRVARTIRSGRRVSGVELASGARLPADCLLLSTGVVPNVELAAASELPVADGIVVDGRLTTPDPRILAIGDCASFPTGLWGRVRLESVQNAADQGRHAAARILGCGAAYEATPWFWSEQDGQRLQIAGLPAGCDEAVVTGSPEEMAFSVLCYRRERLIGVESVNRPAEHMAARRAIAADIGPAPREARSPFFDFKAWVAQATTPIQHIERGGKHERIGLSER